MSRRATMMEAILREHWAASRGGVSVQTAREFYRTHAENDWWPAMARVCQRALGRMNAVYLVKSNCQGESA